MSERQDRPLENESHINNATLDCVELPKFVLDIPSFVPKQPKHADVDRSVRELGVNITENLCDIEVSAKWYAKNIRETPMDRGV